MTLDDIIQDCQNQIKAIGEHASVGYIMPGRWTKRNTRRLWPNGPKGDIVSETTQGVYVLFNAKEVLDAAKQIKEKMDDE